ncbi:MAG: tail fiber domain-containing protein [Verrucomicrobiota bacterium]
MHTGDMAMAQATSRPPERMTYQGFIAGTDGVGLGNTAPKNYDVIFRIYDGESSNTPLWGEQQTVTVDKGYFSVLLGEGAAVPGTPNAGITLSSLFNSATASDRYVGFTVKGIGTGGAEVEILPRVRFMTSPYAFLANRALGATKIIQDNAAGTDLLSGSGSALTLNGRLNVLGANIVEFGSGIAGKEGAAGTISYGAWSNGDSLDIVGAGMTGGARKIRFWNEGGAFFHGPVTASGNSTVNGDLGVNGAITINGGLLANGPITAQTLGLSGDMSVANITMTGNIATSGDGIILGNGKPKAYPWNGSITYGDFNNKGGSLVLQGGGNQIANRQITLYAEGGCTVIGNLNLWGNRYLEFGSGASKQNSDNGTIGYQRYSAGLDIIGAGLTVADRRVTIWGETQYANFVGIGTAPTYPLDVSGSSSYGGSLPVSARFSQWIVCATVMQVSDRRIKDVVGESDASRDMENLRKIRITDYRMKDRNPNDQRVIKGVIAQELRESLPDAVAEIPNIIPSAPVEAASVERAPGVAPVVAKFAAPHGIQKGDRVRLEIDGRTQDVNVTEVVDDRTLAFEGGIEVPKTVRVVGREVKDFLNVDYQQIYMTAVSALQEVDRRLQAVDQRVQEVEKREARMADLEKKAARVENLERDVAELRKLMAAIQSGAGKGATSASVGGSSSGAVASSR